MADGNLYGVFATAVEYQRIDLGHTTWTTKDGAAASNSSFIQAKSSTFLMSCNGPNLAISTDGGANFTNTSIPVHGGHVYTLQIGLGGCADRSITTHRIYAAWVPDAGFVHDLFHSDDTGATWVFETSVVSIVGIVDNLRCSPDNDAYVLCGIIYPNVPSNGIAVTVDSGTTWNFHHLPLGNDSTCAFWGYGNRIIAVGGNIQYRVWTSDDFGASWTLRYEPSGQGLGRDMLRLGNNTLMLLSEMNPTTYQFMQRSTDNGSTWETIEPPPGVNFSTDYEQAICYDPALDMLYTGVVLGHPIWQLPSPATASASAPAWAAVADPSGGGVGINGLCIVPSVSPPSGGPGGGGGPPRFGPFHPTRLQRFQRNVLVKPTPKALG